MKSIQKGEEPESFANWKKLANENWTPTYDGLRGEVKTDLHHSLLREQGYICCYCGMGIAVDSSHLEHLKPQRYYQSLALEYRNLLASCQRESKKFEPVHCGKKKDDWYDEQLMVSPLEANCADFFRYQGSGEILPTDEADKKDAAAKTIDKLGLDIDKLRAMRREAIDGILEAIDGLTGEEIQLLAQGCEKPDANGQYTPFCGAITYILKHYFVP